MSQQLLLLPRCCMIGIEGRPFANDPDRLGR